MRRRQDPNSLRPEWWTYIPSQWRNRIRDWEAEINAGTFSEHGKAPPFFDYIPGTRGAYLKLQIPFQFACPEEYRNTVASRSAPNVQIETLYCNRVPTSPRSLVGDHHEDEEEPVQRARNDRPSSPSILVSGEPRERRRDPERGASFQRVQISREAHSPATETLISSRFDRQRNGYEPSEPPLSPKLRRRRRRPQPVDRPRPNTSPFLESGELFETNIANDVDNELDSPVRKRRRDEVPMNYLRFPKPKDTPITKLSHEIAYPVTAPRGKLYMDTRDLRKLPLNEVPDREGTHVQPEALLHYTPSVAILEALPPVQNHRFQETKTNAEIFDSLKSAALDRHRDRLVNTTRGRPEQKKAWKNGPRPFGDMVEVQANFGDFND